MVGQLTIEGNLLSLHLLARAPDIKPTDGELGLMSTGEGQPPEFFSGAVRNKRLVRPTNKEEFRWLRVYPFLTVPAKT